MMDLYAVDARRLEALADKSRRGRLGQNPSSPIGQGFGKGALTPGLGHLSHRRAAKSIAGIAEHRYLESRASRVAARRPDRSVRPMLTPPGPPCGGDGRVAGAGREWAGACAHSFGFSSQIIPSLASWWSGSAE
ncbi:hypothetical protein ACIQZB_32280 [Streptomyces sp. NPDC097727]|uniref:hypothetical protein n=1 Tax=Streptomyces sp. NPDC097727 TaxID=3366092 RepID=UPI003819AF75